MLATTIHKSNTTPHHQNSGRQQPNFLIGSRPNTCGQTTSGFPHSGRRGDGLVVSKPNSVPGNLVTAVVPPPTTRLLCTRPAPTTGVEPPPDSPVATAIRDRQAR